MKIYHVSLRQTYNHFYFINISYICRVVRTKIQHAVAHNFGVPANKIFLTKPTFFSRMTNVSAQTIHDEYWHPHVDKVYVLIITNQIISSSLFLKLISYLGNISII